MKTDFTGGLPIQVMSEATRPLTTTEKSGNSPQGT